MNKTTAVVIGLLILLVGALIAYNNGAQVQNDPGTLEERTLQIGGGKVFEKDRTGRLTILPDVDSTVTFREVDFEKVLEVEDVEYGSALAFSRGQVDHKDEELIQNLIGITNDRFLDVYGFTLELGDFFSDDVDENVIVVGQTVKEQLAKKGVEPLGQTLLVRGQKFKIIGVLNRIDTGNEAADADWNKLLLLPFGKSDPILEDVPWIKEMRLVISSKLIVDNSAEEVKTVLLNHRGEEDFTVFTQQDLATIESFLPQ